MEAAKLEALLQQLLVGQHRLERKVDSMEARLGALTGAGLVRCVDRSLALSEVAGLKSAPVRKRRLRSMEWNGHQSVPAPGNGSEFPESDHQTVFQWRFTRRSFRTPETARVVLGVGYVSLFPDSGGGTEPRPFQMGGTDGNFRSRLPGIPATAKSRATHHLTCASASAIVCVFSLSLVSHQQAILS